MEMGVAPDRPPGCCWRRWSRGPGTSTLTLGVLVGGGSVCLGYTGQSLFLPNWFVRRRGLAMSLAFSGVGVGSIVLLPWLQTPDRRGSGWRAACWAMAAPRLLAAGAAQPPAAPPARRTWGLAARRRPALAPARGARRPANVVDAAWAAVDWTLARARAPPASGGSRSATSRPLRLVRGAGAPDQVPDRDRLQRRRTRPGRSAS